jgi:hypothetical protein
MPDRASMLTERCVMLGNETLNINTHGDTSPRYAKPHPSSNLSLKQFLVAHVQEYSV